LKIVTPLPNLHFSFNLPICTPCILQPYNKEESDGSKEKRMVTKKRVFVTILIIMMVVSTVTAGAVYGRGGFGGYGAGAVIADEELGDDVTRPIMRWETMTEEELAACPMFGDDVDIEAIREFQAQRAALRDEAQLGAGYGPSRGYAGNTRGVVQNRQSYGHHMMDYRGNAASYGPARARW
jgi:hypothetical protein